MGQTIVPISGFTRTSAKNCGSRNGSNTPVNCSKGARSIYIKVATDNPDLTKKYKFYEVPSRWLHELYPADEIFERDLGIPKAKA